MATYRLALQEGTRERAPLDWAQTQMNLGVALFRSLENAKSGTGASRGGGGKPIDWRCRRLTREHGCHSKGDGTNEPRHCALEARRARGRDGATGGGSGSLPASPAGVTHEQAPRLWAMMQMNLAIALATLGEREPGTGHLEEAVSGYQLVLQEMTRERVPLQWAMTQMNLGFALFRLGERESGTERLEEAVSASRLALEEMTRERSPLEWARVQLNLGAALVNARGA